ncbi:MAG: ATP-binding protein [Erysipelotrichaceae bacterium]|nr:ATP-binding protein [Erysipelotrichaceae bacterium]
MTKDIEMIKDDLYMRELIERYGFSDAYLSDHYNSFLRVLESRELCRNCKGLDHCIQLSKGQRLAFSFDDILMEEIEYCPYALKVEEKSNLKDKYLYCDIPNQLLDLDMNNIRYTEKQERLYALLAAILLKKSHKGLYIYGDLGVGKTYLCVALANSLVKNNEKVAFVKVSDFFYEIRNNIYSNPEIAQKSINALKKADYLFLDDIGSESVSEFIRDDILLGILEYRLENQLLTVFTSNLSKEELLKHYQYDRKEKSNLMKAKRLLERIDILADDFVLTGENMRRRTQV